MSPHGPDPVSSRFCRQAAPGLGPPRPAQHEVAGDCFITPTVGSRQFRRDRSPNGVAWRFPDWTAVGFALPSPFLGSHNSAARHLSTTDFRVVLGSTHHPPIDSLDAARCITCGDVNPDCFMGLFFSPLVSGGLGYRSLLSQTVLPVPFSTVAGRRLPLCPLLLASHSFTVAGSRTPYHEAFSFFAVHFRARRREEIYPAHVETPNNFNKCRFRYPHTARKCL